MMVYSASLTQAARTSLSHGHGDEGFVLSYDALHRSVGDLRTGDPLKRLGVVFERPSVLNVFRTRCRAVCARVRRVRAADRLDRVGAKNDVVAAQLEGLRGNGDGRKYVSRYYILVTHTSFKDSEFVQVKAKRKSRALVAGAARVACVCLEGFLCPQSFISPYYLAILCGFWGQSFFYLRRVRVFAKRVRVFRVCGITYA